MFKYSKPYTFKKSDFGAFGKAFEMSIKDALNRPNPDIVSKQGKPDFRYHRKCYDVKQNGTIIKYDTTTNYIEGSSRVIYASHIAYKVISEDAETITFAINLADTDMRVVDRREFVRFLLDNGHAKINKSRDTVNIQTLYNYKKDAYHGLKGYDIEAWTAEHEIDDDIIGDIWDGLKY